MIAVEDGLNGEGVVAPYGPAGRRRRGRPEPLYKMRRRLLDERPDPIGASVVERTVELGEGGLKRLPHGGVVGDRLATVVLMLQDGVEPSGQGLFGRDRLLGV